MSSMPPPPPYASAGFGRNEALAKVSTPGLVLIFSGDIRIDALDRDHVQKTVVREREAQFPYSSDTARRSKRGEGELKR